MRYPVVALALISILFASGCGDDGGGAGEDAGLEADASERPYEFGGDRPVWLEVPPEIEAGETYPLLMILHGYSATGFLQQSVLQLRNIAADANIFVLAPEGTVDQANKQFWNADPACCDIYGSGVDDSGYLRGVLDDVIAAWPVDPARVFLVGHSNGAFMAYRMACDHADVVTAIAGLAGGAASTPSACTPAEAVSVLHMHGTADDVIPYAGGASGIAPGAVESLAQWSELDGCTGTLEAAGTLDIESTLDGAETAVEVTAGCPDGLGVDLWRLEGGSHLPVFDPSFADALWDWFSAHPRT
jgi:polyhydroxybutyrate depolymerase